MGVKDRATLGSVADEDILVAIGPATFSAIAEMTPGNMVVLKTKHSQMMRNLE